jgi:parallel beta-helix repeat protein
MATFTISPGSDAVAAFDAALADVRLSPGADTITVEAGTYELSRAIQLTQADSGTTFVADGEVVLDGGGARISLVTMSGASDISLSGFTLVNTSGAGNDDFDSAPGSIQIEGGSNITLDANTFREVAVGVRTDDGANHVTVSNNKFTDTQAGAVFINYSQQNTVTGNTILRSGAVYTEGAAIDLFESWGNTVSHNSIKDVPRHGIEEQNWDPANKSGGNLIEYNRITNYMGRTEDGGAIYLFGGDDPYTPLSSTIQYNRIEGTADDFSWGIYLDDLVNGANVIGNYVDGGGVANLMLHGGDRNELANNVLLNGGQYGITVQTGLVDPGPIRFDNIHHNIVAPGTGIWGASDAAPQQWHDNIYVGTEGLFGWDFEPFDVWQEAGGDRGTVVLDSLPGGIGDPDNPIDGPGPGDLPEFPDGGFDPDLPNFRPDWDPILDRPEEPGEPGVPLNVLVLQLSADYRVVEPAFIVSVDGEEVGEGSVEALHGEGTDRFVFRGDWEPGEHELTIQFTNDNFFRNLYAEDVWFGGQTYSGPNGQDVNVGNLPGDRLTFTVGQ